MLFDSIMKLPFPAIQRFEMYKIFSLGANRVGPRDIPPPPFKLAINFYQHIFKVTTRRSKCILHLKNIMATPFYVGQNTVTPPPRP